MSGLSKDQRIFLSEFCANFAVAWFAAGIIGPTISGVWPLLLMLISSFWGGVLLIFGVLLTRGGRR